MSDGYEIEELPRIEAALDALVSPTSADVFQATRPFDERAIASVAAQRAGNGGSQPVTLSTTDPGAIGAGQMWLRLDPMGSWAPMLYVRNETDDGWEDLAGAGYLLGLTYYDDEGNVTAAVNGTPSAIQLFAPSGALNIVGSGGTASLTGTAVLLLGGGTSSVQVLDNQVILRAGSGPAPFYVTDSDVEANFRVLIGTDALFPLAADKGAAVIGHSNEISDQNLSPGWCGLSYDQTNGAAKLKIKAKTADGTVVHGEIALT